LRGGGNGITKTLTKFPTPVIVGVIKQYLRELPESLIPQDFYTTLKLLYLSKSEDFDARTRNASVRALLATLPTCHYETLSMLMYTFSRAKGGEEAIAGVWGPIIVAPPREGERGVGFDKHPVRVVRDLICCTGELVGDEKSVVEEVSDEEGDTMIEVGVEVEEEEDSFAFVQE
jgi:hypothetical protein